ncbi:hypothetical protein [Winogradskyella sp. PC D3.3]
MKKRLIILSLVIVLFLILEIFLRQYLGFCDTVLMKEDSNYEYIAQPNQNRFRFRNHIKYNSFSMRSDEIDTTAIKILGFGDSVINGGVLTDQDSLGTTLLCDTLTDFYDNKIQFLNISAGSWGPDNCYAYLKKHGDWGAKAIFLFISSHDAYDNMDFENVIGVLKNFPRKQYSLALYELIDRYLIPRLKSKLYNEVSELEKLGINKKKDNSVFNTGFNDIFAYSTEKNIPLIFYLHADKNELQSGSYNEQGQMIIDFANQNSIPIILDMENGLGLTDFRDGIHINSKGQKKLANTIARYLMGEIPVFTKNVFKNK